MTAVYTIFCPALKQAKNYRLEEISRNLSTKDMKCPICGEKIPPNNEGRGVFSPSRHFVTLYTISFTRS